MYSKKQTPHHANSLNSRQRRSTLVATIMGLTIFMCTLTTHARTTALELALGSPIQMFEEYDNVAGVRLNLIWGLNKDVYGLDVGGLNVASSSMRGINTGVFGNVAGLRSKKDSAGMQLTLGGNFVKAKYFGVQTAGIFNFAGGGFAGLQLAGLTNISSNNGGPDSGGQITAGVNVAKNTWGQLSGIVNVAEDTGLQISGVFNTGNTSHVQLAAIGNGADNLGALQLAGVVNHVSDRVHGVQIAGVVNHVGGSVSGLQLGGCLNLVQNNVTGFQIGVLGNRVKGKVSGIQIGLVNRGEKVEGVQIGLFNFASQLKGVQLGLLNKIENGVIPLLPVFNFGASFGDDDMRTRKKGTPTATTYGEPNQPQHESAPAGKNESSWKDRANRFAPQPKWATEPNFKGNPIAQ